MGRESSSTERPAPIANVVVTVPARDRLEVVWSFNKPKGYSILEGMIRQSTSNPIKSRDS